MWHDNTLTRKLGIRYPIVQAGMAGGSTTPTLIAAVSNAGGLGTLGAGYMSPEDMQTTIQQIKILTDQPFGVNIFIPEKPNVAEDEIKQANALLRPFRQALAIDEPEVTLPTDDLFNAQLNILIEERVPVCSFTFGVPSKKQIHQLKQANITVIGTATTVNEAIINEEQGMDMIVVQGSEAGGHRGTFTDSFEQAMIGTMALVPQTADHVTIPVIAAGGIMDGRGVLASLTLGAQAAQMGTAFITALESGAKPQHIHAILHSTEEQTVMTSSFSGKPARGIRNEFIAKLAPYEQELPSYPIQNMLTKEIRAEAAKQNRPEWLHLWSGQNPRSSTRKPAGEIIEAIIADINDLINAR